MSGAASATLLRGALDYLLNCAWQAPLVALAAIALTKAVRLSLRSRCAAFAGALLLVGVAPLVPIHILTGGAALAASGASASAGPPTATLASALLAPVGTLAAEGLVFGAGLAVAIAVIRLAVGWVAARRLVRRSMPVRLPEAATRAMRDFLARGGRAVPQVRTCEGVAGPAVVGAWTPVVLVPPGFEALPEEQLVAALLHECAHVARRDYALNLMCETLALPSSWHPAAGVLKRRFRAAREAACDQLAAAALGSPSRYARCLVELARTMEGGRRLSGPALQLLGRGELEDRVRKLTAPVQGAARLHPLQTAAAVALALGCIAPLTCLHLTPVLRDGEASREVARVAVFDGTARAKPGPLAVASLRALPSPSPRRRTSARRAVFARLRTHAAVQVALAMPPVAALAPLTAVQPVAGPSVAAPPAVAAPAMALARLDEAGDVGRIVFAVAIAHVSPCLVPAPQTDAARATSDPPPPAVPDVGQAADFDPFALAPSPNRAVAAPAAPTATQPSAAAAPTCLKAASLRPMRRHGLA